MSAWILSLSSLCAIVVATILVAVAGDRTERNLLAFAALGFGLISGIALATSGFMLASGWAERMESFDFAPYEPIMDARRRVTGGPLTGIYYLPYITIALGAAATYAFGYHLYLHIRDRDTYAGDDDGD